MANYLTEFIVNVKNGHKTEIFEWKWIKFRIANETCGFIYYIISERLTTQ